MAGHRFKLKIVSSYLFILTVGMVLINVVVVTFLQREMIVSQVEHGLDLLKIVVDQSQFTEQDDSLQYYMRAMQSLPGKAGNGVVNVAYRSGNDFKTLVDVKADLLKKVVNLAMVSPVSVVQYHERVWTVFSPGVRYVVMAEPIRTQSEYRSSIGVVLDLKPSYEMLLGKQRIFFSYILVNVMILSVVGLFRMAKFVLRPLDNLVKISESYDWSESGMFFTEKGDGGFGKLAVSLNMMLRRINRDREKLNLTVKSLETANEKLRKSQKEIVTAEKMSAVGVLSAGLAHEIGNPLGVVQGYLELLSDHTANAEDRKQFADRAISEVERIDALIQQMLRFSKPSDPQSGIGSVEQILNELESMLAVHREMRDITYSMKIDIDSSIQIKGKDRLLQVLLNCILNSVDAVHEEIKGREKKITLVCSIDIDLEEKRWLNLQIRDNGSGISEKLLPAIFDPFFSTKVPGKGTGLGLSVSFSLIDAMGGKIKAESDEGVGTTLFIVLPVFESSIVDGE